jgi:hypothetical protein
MIGHFISATCQGEFCSICLMIGESAGGGREPATHKVGEEIAYDEPIPELFPGFKTPDRHNFTAYLCCEHFRWIMGRAVFCPKSYKLATPVQPVTIAGPALPECEKCGGAGWLRGRELDNHNEDTWADTMTKYTCDRCKGTCAEPVDDE